MSALLSYLFGHYRRCAGLSWVLAIRSSNLPALAYDPAMNRADRR